MGIDMADQLWICRYIMHRLSEDFSTESTRNDVDLKNITAQLEGIKKNHMKCIQVYGANNYERLSGAHETSAIDQFS